MEAVECAPVDSTRGSTSSFMWETDSRLAILFPFSFSSVFCIHSSLSNEQLSSTTISDPVFDL